jgi:hypothetical protein
MNSFFRNGLVVLVCGAAGGVLGYLLFVWLIGRGMYALALPGGLFGVGAGLCRNRSLALCFVCGLVGLALGLVTEWRFAPFRDDGSLSYFLTHVHELRAPTWIMIVVGALVSFWGPFSQYRRSARPGSPAEPSYGGPAGSSR